MNCEWSPSDNNRHFIPHFGLRLQVAFQLVHGGNVALGMARHELVPGVFEGEGSVRRQWRAPLSVPCAPHECRGRVKVPLQDRNI